MSNYGFKFGKADFSRPQGQTSEGEEHFRGAKAAESLVRELTQNSLDAARNELDGPVKMIFELKEIDTAHIPDFDNLRKHIKKAARDAAVDETNDRLSAAAQASENERIHILRIGDYGTTGLRGMEGKDEIGAPLVALTRGSGISADKSDGGGSFGIGAAVNTLYSELLTAMWCSFADDKTEPVFAGYSQLASHKDEKGDWLNPDGFYVNLDRKDDFEYLRSSGEIRGFEDRKEFGTDTYILGYRDAETDPSLIDVRNAFIENFLVAILRGHLEVEGRAGGKTEWYLSSKNLESYVDEVDGARSFYRAMMNEPYVEEDVAGMGRLELYVEPDSTLKKTLNTIVMRSPLMRVREYRHTSIRQKYAAVMICSDEPGNKMLRKLEPPRHNDWEARRASYGATAVKNVKDFIKRGLQSVIKTRSGEELSISGLEKNLPSNMTAPNISSASPVTKKPTPGIPSAEESAGTTGDENAYQQPAVNNPNRNSVKPTLRREATSEGTEEINRGQRSDLDGERDSEGGYAEGLGSEGAGTGTIRSNQVKMRSWSDPESGEIILMLRSLSPASGELRLGAIGSGGEVVDDYLLPIESVRFAHSPYGGGSTASEVEFDGNSIKGLDFPGPNVTRKLVVKMRDDRRFRLGVI